VVLVNGRMSSQGFGRYKLVGSILRSTFRHYDRFFFKSKEDADRYRQFGVPSEKFEVAGDMKFDTPLWPRSTGRREEIRFRLGADTGDFIVVAGSTRPGEEHMLLDVLQVLRRADSAVKLVLAPRHLDRLDDVKQVCSAAGFDYTIYGDVQNGRPVVLVDRMGLLMDLYMAADAAFVGGTLVDIGGHNILEPVWAGTPVFFGPSLNNVRDAAEYITEKNFGAQVATGAELGDELERLRCGERTFAEKTEHDLEGSATARAGEYILGKLGHA